MLARQGNHYSFYANYFTYKNVNIINRTSGWEVHFSEHRGTRLCRNKAAFMPKSSERPMSMQERTAKENFCSTIKIWQSGITQHYQILWIMGFLFKDISSFSDYKTISTVCLTITQCLYIHQSAHLRWSYIFMSQ